MPYLHNGIERILLQYPQVITHTNYKCRSLYTNQIVWLKLDCPFDGGTKGLCLKFLHSIDRLLKTNYYKKFGIGKTIEQMLPEMAHVSTIHGLGVLVIDEIQNLNLAKSGGHQKMLNFLLN